MELLISIVIFVSVTITSAVYLYFKRSFSYWKSLGVPYEEPIFPYGNFKGVSRTITMNDVLQRIYGNHKTENSPLIGVYVFGKPVFVPTDLDFIKKMLIKDFNYFTDHGMYYNEKDDPLSANVFALDGQEWRSMRNKLTPLFTSGKIKLMFETFVSVGTDFAKAVEERIQMKDIIEVKDLMERFTTDVIGSCAFGINCNTFKDPDSEFHRMANKVFTEHRHSAVIETLMFMCKNLAKKLHMKFNFDDVTEFFLRIVRETMEYREKNNILRNDFMNIIMKLKKVQGTPTEQDGLTLEQIASQLFVFFIAGFETSSTAMSFCLYELALNTEIQNKLRREINQVLEKHNGQVCYEAIKEMTYMDQVINETLRKYPPLSNLMRVCVHDYPIPGTNLVIKKDTFSLIPIWSIHHDPQYYENPEKFDPERFLPENAKNRHPMAFIPFGDGPRNCVGLRFGLLQIRVGLTFLLKNFQFENTPQNQYPLEFEPNSITLRAKHGIYLKIKKI